MGRSRGLSHSGKHQVVDFLVDRHGPKDDCEQRACVQECHRAVMKEVAALLEGCRNDETFWLRSCKMVVKTVVGTEKTVESAGSRRGTCRFDTSVLTTNVSVYAVTRQCSRPSQIVEAVLTSFHAALLSSVKKHISDGL